MAEYVIGFGREDLFLYMSRANPEFSKNTIDSLVKAVKIADAKIIKHSDVSLLVSYDGPIVDLKSKISDAGYKREFMIAPNAYFTNFPYMPAMPRIGSK